MKSRRWLAIVVAIILVFVSLGFRFATSVASGFWNDAVSEIDVTESKFHENVLIEGDSQSQIAVLTVEGVIQGEGGLFGAGYDHQSFLKMIDTAAESEAVEAIILEINSPGGAVAETAQIHRALVALQEEYDKPVYATMGNTAASGGYYIAAPTDKIFAESSTITGSIGVIMENVNFTKLAEEYGIEFNTFTSGKHKDILSSSREMTEEEKDIIQSIIDEMYDEFVDVIVEGRQMDEKRVREIADGRIYTGNQAKEVDLVDEVGSFDDALQALMDDYDLDNAEVIQYKTGGGFFNPFKLTLQNLFESQTSEIDMIMELLNKSNKPRAMYIY